MTVPLSSFTFARVHKLFLKKDMVFLFLSISIQLILGILFGHLYDIRLFMATGYLVGTGQNPYISQDLSALFHNLSFQNLTTIGYPPPWALMLGLIYRVTYSIIPNFLFYNLAIKLPVIAANIGLAYTVAGVLRRLGSDTLVVHKAWKFMLFNPFLLYATVAWGQFDSIVALLALSALILLDSGKIKVSAILLALAISFKPTALPLILVPYFYLQNKSIRQVFSYYGFLFFGGLLFCVVPFIIFNWDPSPIFQNWNAHFTVGGGMAFMAYLELITDSYQLGGSWWFLGLLWVPALGATAYLLRHGIIGFKDLLKKSTALILVFFLTRAWLSEPNIVLVLPFILILTSIGEFDRLTLTAIWILPFIFSFFNTATAQLFFPSMPAVMDKLLKLAEDHRTLRLIAKLVIVIPWQITGWFVFIRSFKKVHAPSVSIIP